MHNIVDHYGNVNWNHITHTLEWQKLERLTITSVNGKTEQWEFSNIINENAKWYTLENNFEISYNVYTC